MNKPEYNLNISSEPWNCGRSKRGPRQEKLNKARGIEDIPNQELKSPKLTRFAQDLIPSVC